MTNDFNSKNSSEKIDKKEMADHLALLASIINNQPDESFVKWLRKYYKENLANIERDDIEKFLHENSHLSDSKMAEELAVDWTRLFRGISPQYGPRPPYAGLFISNDAAGMQTISLLKQEYIYNGLPLENDKRDRADYLGYEIDFIAYLTNKIDLAEKAQDKKAIKHNLEVTKRFMEIYVTSWTSQFINEALQHAKSTFFKSYLVILEEYLSFVSHILEHEFELITSSEQGQ